MTDRIPKIGLTIFDMYETLVIRKSGIWQLRPGTEELVSRLGNKVIASDGQYIKIRSHIGNLQDAFDDIYSSEIVETHEKIKYKNLGKICQRHHVPPSNAVMVGDNFGGMDKRSAEKYGIPFIQVPRKNYFSLMNIWEDLCRL